MPYRDWRRRSLGASLIELALCLPILLFIGLGILQAGLNYHAKINLNYAAFEAARAGAVNHALLEPMKQALGVRLAPVMGGTGQTKSALRAIARASQDIKDPRFTQLEILNPTSAAFADWGLTDPVSGRRVIPNSHLRQRAQGRVVKVNSGVTLQDANLLSIKVIYGYTLSVPLLGRWFANALKLIDPARGEFYRAGRIPLEARATVRMQSQAWQAESATEAEDTGAQAAIPPVARPPDLSTISGLDESTEPPSESAQDAAQLESLDNTGDNAIKCDSHGLNPDLNEAEINALLLAQATVEHCDVALDPERPFAASASQDQLTQLTDCAHSDF